MEPVQSSCTVTALNDRVAKIQPVDANACFVAVTTFPVPETVGFKCVDDLSIVLCRYFIGKNDYISSGALNTRPSISKGQTLIVELTNHNGGEILAVGW